MKNISWLGICFAVCGGFIAVDAAAVSPGLRGGLGSSGDSTHWGSSGSSSSKVTSCTARNGQGTNDNEVLVATAKSKHFRCEQDMCSHGAYVGILGNGKIRWSDKTYTDAWFKCSHGLDDYWEKADTIDKCTDAQVKGVDKDSRLLTKAVSNSTKVLVDTRSGVVSNGYVVASDSFYSGTGNAKYFCVAYQCNNTYKLNAAKTACERTCAVGQRRSVTCPANIAHAKVCEEKCDGSYNWVLNVVGCEDGYDVASGGKQCVAKPKPAKGGGAPVIVPVPSPTPVPKPAPKPAPVATVSEVDQLRSVCKNAMGAVWDEATKSCTCSDSSYEWNGSACVASAAFVQCQALVSAGSATWNSVTKVCMCVQTGYTFNGIACVESAESIAARKAEQAQAAKAAITSVHSKLKKTQSGFDVSAWKDEEGKFNTARLASDSIAGAVLGTTGALVTNSAVKKHQVEDGFEAIQCAIGNDIVADWGETFRIDEKPHYAVTENGLAY